MQISKKFYFFVSMLLIFTLVMVGCGSSTIDEGVEGVEDVGSIEGAEASESSEGLEIIATVSIIADIATNIVGDRGNITYLVPIGEEPEEYEPTPSDFQRVSDADVLFANGLNFEGWLEQLLANISDIELVHVTDGAPTIKLVGQDLDDPHLWLDVKLIIDYYVENILNTVIRLDPEGEDIYRENADTYISKLQELEDWIVSEVSTIPEEGKVIIISENAFKYFADAYGFETDGIWELNAHEEGTPQQISRIVELVKDKNVPALFVETTVSRRYMEMIENETGVPIVGELYTDAIGKDGSGADSYIKMMQHNVETIVSGLK